MHQGALAGPAKPAVLARAVCHTAAWRTLIVVLATCADNLFIQIYYQMVDFAGQTVFGRATEVVCTIIARRAFVRAAQPVAQSRHFPGVGSFICL